MNAANVPLKIRYNCKVWIVAFQHATNCTNKDGLVVTTINGKTTTRFEQLCGQLPKYWA
jgi:hypothetical protein